ncbi:hypothetical protein [Humidisolicoccus flavus]|uniref:hypothetical protein n=1 Tax=Humidisolicoccus flavus TaxID=3111414 RepID=UPI00324DA79D
MSIHETTETIATLSAAFQESLDALIAQFIEGIEPASAHAAVEHGVPYAESLAEPTIDVATIGLLAIARASEQRARDEVLARVRVFWQGNAEVSRDDVQLQSALGTLHAHVFAAESSVRRALVHEPSRASSQAAFVIAAQAAQSVSTTLFDLLGASAVSTKKGLHSLWLSAARLKEAGSLPQITTSLGASLLSATRVPE